MLSVLVSVAARGRLSDWSQRLEEHSTRDAWARHDRKNRVRPGADWQKVVPRRVQITLSVLMSVAARGRLSNRSRRLEEQSFREV